MGIASRIRASLTARVFSFLNRQLRKRRKKMSETLPNFSLGANEIKNLKALVDREELLKRLPKGGVVAEIGVNKGDFSQQILTIAQPQKIHLIDVWSTDRYNDAVMDQVINRFKHEMDSGQVMVNRGLSIAAVSQFPDQYFDWIYIDSDHSFSTTREELRLYKTKMKKGGIIAGHDFIQGGYVSGIKYGVIEAVTEFCLQNKWEMIYLTMDYSSHPSFAIREIQGSE